MPTSRHLGSFSASVGGAELKGLGWNYISYCDLRQVPILPSLSFPNCKRTNVGMYICVATGTYVLYGGGELAWVQTSWQKVEAGSDHLGQATVETPAHQPANQETGAALGLSPSCPLSYCETQPRMLPVSLYAMEILGTVTGPP